MTTEIIITVGNESDSIELGAVDIEAMKYWFGRRTAYTDSDFVEWATDVLNAWIAGALDEHAKGEAHGE